VPPGHGFIDELKSHDSVHRVVFILIVCVIAPVIEEIYFRGLLFPITSLHLGTRVGALLSAVLFILGHLSLGILFAAAIYTLLVYRYRSIFPSVFAHIAYNTVMVIHVIV
jgi:membrane protease YdiL (CAAX protease family)